MTELERDIKTAKKFASDVRHKSGSIFKRTLCLTKDYAKAATNRCYCGVKRVVKITADALKDNENSEGN